jgi:hypothetical protein
MLSLFFRKETSLLAPLPDWIGRRALPATCFPIKSGACSDFPSRRSRDDHPYFVKRSAVYTNADSLSMVVCGRRRPAERSITAAGRGAGSKKLGFTASPAMRRTKKPAFSRIFCVRERGLEPPRDCSHMALNHACLPIPALARIKTVVPSQQSFQFFFLLIELLLLPLLLFFHLPPFQTAYLKQQSFLQKETHSDPRKLL